MPDDQDQPPPRSELDINLGLISDSPPPAESVTQVVVDAHALELQTAEIDRLKLVNDKLRIANTDSLANMTARKTYAGRLFLLLTCWLALVGYVVLAQGFG